MSPAYMRSVLGGREAVLDEILRESLLIDNMPTLQIDDNAGLILQLLTTIHKPRHVLELGTLFGYSTIYLARGLPDGGKVTTLEIDPSAATLARRNVEKAGVADRVEIVVADALDYLSDLAGESFGMIFIDADKKSYPTYLTCCLPLLEPGGLLIADDAFAEGDYSQESAEGDEGRVESEQIRNYARQVGETSGLFSAFIGTETGLLISRKI